MQYLRRKSYPQLIACSVVLLLAGRSLAASDPLGDYDQVKKLQNTLAAVAEAVSPTVVAIRAERPLMPANATLAPETSETSGEQPPPMPHLRPAIGSGVIVDATGGILTNEHVVGGADPSQITCTLSSGEVYSVRSITTDPRSDLAILRIDAHDLPQARLGDVAAVKQGHFAIVLGNPRGTASEDRGRPSMSFGIISELGRCLTRQLDPITDERYYGNLIQTDARIVQGNSGGPLLNLRGEVIGIVVATSTPTGISDGVGYAIPIDRRTKTIIAKLIKGQTVEYGFLGVRLDEPTDEDRDLAGAPDGTQGALVRDLDAGTPAERAKLQAGDLIVEFDGDVVHNSDELIRMVGSAQVGIPVNIVYYRDGTRRTVKISPAPRDVTGVHVETPTTWRGLTFAELSPELREKAHIPQNVQGLLITKVDETYLSNAAQGVRQAIRPGSVVQRVNAKAVSNLGEFSHVVEAEHGPIELTIWVAGETIEIRVTADAADK